jgi:hypothetical protein
MGADYPSVGWPKCGEIDILEMGNSNGIKRVHKINISVVGFIGEKVGMEVRIPIG